MTKEELAALLNGREYGDEINPDQARIAKANGLVVVYGASDDLMEFEGAIRDEFGCYDGGTAIVDAEGLLRDWESVKKDGDKDEIARHLEREKTARTIEALWAPDGKNMSWAYKTEIPHATFDVMEDGEIYCRGIVFALAAAHAEG